MRVIVLTSEASLPNVTDDGFGSLPLSSSRVRFSGGEQTDPNRLAVFIAGPSEHLLIGLGNVGTRCAESGRSRENSASGRDRPTVSAVGGFTGNGSETKDGVSNQLGVAGIEKEGSCFISECTT